MNELYNLETSTFASGLLQRTCLWSYTESDGPILALSLNMESSSLFCPNAFCCCCCCCWKACCCCCCVSAIKLVTRYTIF